MKAGPSFSHGVEIPPGARVLHLAGQVGVAANGSIAKDIRGQTEQLWTNIRTILHEAGMDIPDIVKMTHYLLNKEDFEGYREIRTKFLAGHRPAGTLLFIAGLGDEGALVEVDIVAAKI
jgi:2-iminobutanoate/2-iminopropanoate deaminase